MRVLRIAWSTTSVRILGPCAAGSVEAAARRRVQQAREAFFELGCEHGRCGREQVTSMVLQGTLQQCKRCLPLLAGCYGQGRRCS